MFIFEKKVTAQVTGWKQRQSAGRPAFLKKSSKKLLSVSALAFPDGLCQVTTRRLPSMHGHEVHSGEAHPEKPKPKQTNVFLLRFLQKKKAFLPLAFAAGHPPGQLQKKHQKTFVCFGFDLTGEAHPRQAIRIASHWTCLMQKHPPINAALRAPTLRPAGNS